MKQRYYDEAVERAPIDDLVEIIEGNLASTDVFVRAAKSPLYQEKWLNAGIDPVAIKSFSDLQKFPFTDSADLRVVQESNHPDRFICSPEKPRYWNSTSGSTGIPKWIPVGAADRDYIQNIGNRLLYFIDANPLVEDDVGFGITAPAPFISDSGTWSNMIDELRGKGVKDTARIETVLFSYEDGIAGILMAIKRNVSVFFAFPSLAMLIAEGLSKNAKELAEERFKERFSLLNLIAYLVTRVRKIKAKNILKIHSGLFGGEPLEPYRAALFDAWNMKYSYNLYTSTEFRIGFLECSAQDGMHVWLDACVPEIILQTELDREREEIGYTPKATPLWEAKPDDEGELVVTNFFQTFPLVRWRTSDLIHIVSTSPCTCGRTHPRINILQRSDDLVNLGVIRFSTFAIKEELEKIKQPSAISKWQLRVSRIEYKPLLTVLIKPEKTINQKQMVEEVHNALMNIEALQLGTENELIHNPKIAIDYDLDTRQSSSGKFRPLVYEDEQEGTE
jgi:phenylacetate-CoA ligase